MDEVTLENPVLGFADVVVEFFNSGAGPIDDEPYGGTFDPLTFAGSFPTPVDLSVILGGDPDPLKSFLSLPTDSFVTVGFVDEVIVDGPGDDIFVNEISGQGELADIFVGNGDGNFFLLGRADGGAVASFDLASISFEGFVREVKILGLNDAGGSPGYDVANVRALTSGLINLENPNYFGGSMGEDTIDLGRGADVFFGGQGGDEVIGGRGNDRLFGQLGADRLEGRVGADQLFGGFGFDTLIGGVGNDSLYGSSGRDLVNGGVGADVMYGGFQLDTLLGGSGADTMFGGAGRDNLTGGPGADVMTGGSGADRFFFSSTSGNDEVQDFVVGEDDFEILGSQSLRDGATVEASGENDTLVRFGASSVVLLGVDPGLFEDENYF